MKPEQQNRKYFTIAIYSLIVLLVGIGFVFLLWNFNTVKLYISKILDICSPIMYGALIAYILNPLMKIFEEKVFKNKKEAMKDREEFIKNPDPIFSKFLDDIFGDG